jgi:SAM-dependent MidA family methyltransferase
VADDGAPLRERLLAEIRASGPLTIARYMEVALYDPDAGYYARSERRSGVAGDFYTSVDAGPPFGAAIARLIEQAWATLGRPARLEYVEAAAGNGRLMRDVLDALARQAPPCYEAVTVATVERSAAARRAQHAMLEPHRARVASLGVDLPNEVHGLVFANELLDALPAHRVRATRDGLHEMFVGESAGRLLLVAGPVSTDRLRAYVERLPVPLMPGAVADLSLAVLDWCRQAAGALRSGYLVLVDYGVRGPLGADSEGTLRCFSRHLVDPPDREGQPAWLLEPGERDLTVSVDFHGVEAELCHAGLLRQAFVDQARFLLALGLLDRLDSHADAGPAAAARRRLQAAALVAPEGLGGSHRVLVMRRPASSCLPARFEAPWDPVPRRPPGSV